VVVIKGPDANAGLNPNRFKIKGVIVPTNEEKITTPKRAIDTTNDNRWLPKSKMVAPKTITDKKNPFNKATLKTLLNLL
jgi:hypothetical protein